MDPFITEPSRPSSVTNPEAVLVSIIEEYWDISLPIERLLYTYPVQEFRKKPAIIKRIIESLWDSNFSSVPVESFEKFEKFLHAIDKRDHFVHQFEVFLLGLHLRAQMGDEGFSNDFHQIWMLTSLSHDYGYPHEASGKIFKQLNALYDGIQFHCLAPKIKELQEIPATDIDSLCKVETSDGCYDLLGALCAQIGSDLRLSEAELDSFKEWVDSSLATAAAGNVHGLISALLLLRRSFDGFEVDERVNTDIYGNLLVAASAIAIHSLSEEYTSRIDYNLNKYAYLLYIVDNVQDWDRGLVYDSEYPEYTLSGFEAESRSVRLIYSVRKVCWEDGDLEAAISSLNDKFDALERVLASSPSIEMIVEYRFNKVGIDPICYTLEI